MHKNAIITLAVVAAVAVAGGSFYGGVQYQKSQKPAVSAANFQGRFIRTGAAGMNGTMGTVMSKDAQSVTIQERGGSTKIVFYSSSTQVGKFDQGTSADLAVGQTVAVTGSSNADGSITANSIQIRPTPPQGTTNQ